MSMRRITLPGTNLSVSRICLGTAGLGAAVADIAAGDANARAVIDRYRALGGNFIDTAHVYSCWTPAGAGSAETMIGRYLRNHTPDGLVIATKGGHPGMVAYRQTDHWLAPARVHADIEDSLGRLGVEVIDLYYLHRDDWRVPVGEVMEMMNAEVRAGTIRYFACSNWLTARIAAAQAYSAEHNLQPFVASQVEFSLARKAPPVERVHGDHTWYAQPTDEQWHSASGLPLVAFSSTARGFFARGAVGAGGTGADDRPALQDYVSPTNQRLRTAVWQIAQQRGVTPTQVALAWLLQRPFACLPITGTTSVAHLEENLAADALRLTDEELSLLQR